MQFYSKKIFLMLLVNFIKYLPFLVGRFVGMKQKKLFRDIPRDQRSVREQVNKLLKDCKTRKTTTNKQVGSSVIHQQKTKHCSSSLQRKLCLIARG